MRVSVWSLFTLSLASLATPAWSQSAPVDVSGQVSGIVTLRGPDGNRGSDTATVCVSNLGTRAAKINVMVRDVETLGEMLSLTQLDLEPGQGGCHGYVEQELPERKAIAFVWLVATEPVWNGSRQLRAVKASVAVTDALGDVRAYAELAPKVVSIASPNPALASQGGGRGSIRSADVSQLVWVRPRLAQVAGPIPARGAGSTRAGDVLELCGLNLGGDAVAIVLEIRDAHDIGNVIVSSAVALEPGESRCVSHQPPAGASAPFLTAVVPMGDNWRSIGSSLVATTEVRNPASVGIRSDGKATRVALPSAP